MLANTSVEVVLGILFLFLSNADFLFGAKELTWRSYTTEEALPTSRRVELIDKKKFAKEAMDENSKTFVVHVLALKAPKPAGMPIHPSRAAQIAAQSPSEPTLAAPQWDKTSTEISSEYSDYADVFSTDLAMELPENMGMNEHAIELMESKQPPYGLIYNLGLVEF